MSASSSRRGGGQLEQRPDARAQLGGAHRLLEILLGAELEAGADRLGVDALAGHEDDGDVARGGAGAQAAQRLEAVEAGHRHVEQDERRRARVDRLQAALAVGGLAHAVAGLAQQRDVAETIVGIVVDDQDFVRSRRTAHDD